MVPRSVDVGSGDLRCRKEPPVGSLHTYTADTQYSGDHIAVAADARLRSHLKICPRDARVGTVGTAILHSIGIRGATRDGLLGRDIVRSSTCLDHYWIVASDWAKVIAARQFSIQNRNLQRGCDII